MSSINAATRVAAQLPAPGGEGTPRADATSPASGQLTLCLGPRPASRIGGVLALQSLPDDSVEIIADDLSPLDRASLALASKGIHALVTLSAADPVIRGVYEAQARFRRLRDEGIGGQALEHARAGVQAAVELNARRSSRQRELDDAGREGPLPSCDALLGFGFHSLALELLTEHLPTSWRVKPSEDNHIARCLLSEVQLAMGDYVSARGTSIALGHDYPEYGTLQQAAFLAKVAVIEGNLDALNSLDIELPEDPEQSTGCAVHAVVAESRARQAERAGEIEQAGALRSTMRDLLARDEEQENGGLLWFHAMTGNARAALDYAKARGLRCISGHPEVVNAVMGPDAVDQDARQDWIDYLGAHFELPEQLATLRVPERRILGLRS